jgi:hypothetical protein
MSRHTLPTLILAIFAGAAAGAAVSLALNPRVDAPPAPTESVSADARIDDLNEAVAALERRMEEMQLADSDVSSRLTELEQAEEPPARQASGVVAPDGVHVPRSQVRLGGAPFVFGAGKGAALMSLPEEEKWQKLREELSLDSYQETELKRIRDEMQTQVREAFSFDSDTGTLTGKPDLAQLMEARKNANEKVKNLLSEDQYEKYRKEGYGNAIGLGSSMAVSYTSISTPRDHQGK